MADAGRMQEVLEDGYDSLRYYFKLDNVVVVPSTSVSIRVLSPGGSEIQGPSAVAPAAPIVFTQNWSKSIYPFGQGYRAEWTIVHSGNTYQRITYFDVVKRHFESGLVDRDLTDMIPYLEDQLPSGVTTFARYRQRAWRKIYLWVRQNTGYMPGLFTRPELLFECHRSLALAEVSKSISRREGDEWWTRYNDYKEEADGEFRLAMSLANVDQDADLNESPESAYGEFDADGNLRKNGGGSQYQRFRNWGR